MFNAWVFLTMPLIGAAIGWITNMLAVRLLFKPYQPVRLPGYTIQGLIPGRRFDLARSIGRVVEQQILSAKDLVHLMKSEENMEILSRSVTEAVRGRVMDRLPQLVPVSIKKILADSLADQIQKEIPALVGEFVDMYGHRLEKEIRIGGIIEEKVNSFSLADLENLVLSVASRELRHIEIMGGILGFFIGAAQAFLLWLIS